ncbi:hypothetical protein [Synechococcus sp. UW179A]|uniref:hypothetical protein n=1 Tax=Synechococcus sp. UW179A TaxID=2575510 RepID=UPI00352BEF62
MFGKPLDAAEAIARCPRMRRRWAEFHTRHCLLLQHPISERTSLSLTCVTTYVQLATI